MYKEHKDMYGNPIDVGDIIIFENNSEFEEIPSEMVGNILL